MKKISRLTAVRAAMPTEVAHMVCYIVIGFVFSPT